MAELLLLVLIVYNNTHSVPMRVSPETTYITEPRTPDGKHVDYVAAFKQRLYPPAIATDDNGYRLVFQHLHGAGNSRDLPPKTLRYLCDELGLDPNVKPDLTYRDIYAFIDHVLKNEPEFLEDIVREIREEKEEEEKRSPEVSAMMKSLFPNVRNEPGTVYSFEILDKLDKSAELYKSAVVQRYVEEYGPALDLVVDAVAKPVFFVPMIAGSDSRGLTAAYMESVSFPRDYDPPQEARNYARGLVTRVQYRVATGDVDGAVDDILACYRLGRHFSRHGTMVASFVGVAIEGIADAMAIDANPAVPANEKQLRRLAEGIRNLPPRLSREQICEIERFFVLDTLQSISAKQMPFSTLSGETQIRTLLGWQPTTGDIIANFVLDNLGYDWNIVARQVNEAFTGAIEGTGTERPRSTRSNDNMGRMINAALTGKLSPPEFDPAESNLWNWLSSVPARSKVVADSLSSDMSFLTTCTEVFRRQTCCFNMKQITLAMLIYERSNGTLPPAFSVDAGGKPLHSWRVLLLPYLGDDSLAELYAQIRLDEPWDSEHNRPFHELNLDIYRCPSAVNNDGETNYSMIVGKDLLFGSDGRGPSLAGVQRDILLITERKEGVCWMRPDAEIPQQAIESNYINKSAVSISSNHTGGVNIAKRDGCVEFVSDTINVNVFREQHLGLEKLPW